MVQVSDFVKEIVDQINLGVEAFNQSQEHLVASTPHSVEIKLGVEYQHNQEGLLMLYLSSCPEHPQIKINLSVARSMIS